MKSFLIAALLLAPVTLAANAHVEKKDAAVEAPVAAAAAAALPKCTAKVQDSCDQSTTTEKNALSYYPAETRDAGNNKIAKAKAEPKPM